MNIEITTGWELTPDCFRKWLDKEKLIRCFVMPQPATTSTFCYTWKIYYQGGSRIAQGETHSLWECHDAITQAWTDFCQTTPRKL